jgi:hypothetical protein
MEVILLIFLVPAAIWLFLFFVGWVIGRSFKKTLRRELEIQNRNYYYERKDSSNNKTSN